MPAAVPDTRSLKVLAEAARGCQACDLYLHATQTVFGEGPSRARIVAVGEQPGDVEDRTGRPFTGPAGKVLAKACAEAGVGPPDIYVTNAVKHFKFEERGKRRIHQKPNTMEIQACRPWLEAEIAAIHPDLLLALGATAAQTLLGKKSAIGPIRGQFLEHPWARSLFVTVHPSSILRAQTSQDREREYARFVQDLRLVAGWLRRKTAA